MPNNLPLNWPDKIDSPALQAFFQQFGIEKYLSAAEINQLRDALNELYYGASSDVLNGKANDEEVVHKEGTETILGKKTFFTNNAGGGLEFDVRNTNDANILSILNAAILKFRVNAIGEILATKIAKIDGDGTNVLLDDGTVTSLAGIISGVQTQIDNINVLLASDNVDLDNVQELVDAIETLQTSLSTILVNDVTTGGVTKALTAEQGKVLKGLVDTLTTNLGLKADDNAVVHLSGNETISGIKTFLTGMFSLRNVANTFSSFLLNINTASRTYTLQDKSGTLADTADVATKMNLPTGGVVNYLPKFLTATTMGLSRLFDNGTFFGIGTVNTPTKDITLRSLDNREIGVEDSNNITEGKDLTISAGKTINTVPGTGFVALGQPGYLYRDVVAMSNGDMMIFVNGAVYKQINGSGNLIAFTATGIPTVPLVAISPSNNNILYAVDTNGNGPNIMKKSTDGGASFTNISGEVARAYSDVCVMPNSDVYAIVRSSGGVWKQTGGTGNFVDMGFTSRNYFGFCPMPNGDLYITVNGGDIYKMLAGTSTLTALGQTNRTWGTGYTFAGDVYMRTGGVIYKQTSATGNFISTGISDVATQSNHLAVSITNNVYAPVYANDVFVQFNNGAGTADLKGGTLKLSSGQGKGTGQSRIEFSTGQKTASGTNMQSLTTRGYIDENGYFVYIMNTYVDNATAVSAGLPVNAFYKDSSGNLKIVI